MLAPSGMAQTATIIRPAQAQSYMTGSALGVQLAPDVATNPIRLNIRDTGTVQPTTPDPVSEWNGTAGANSPDFSPTALFEHWAPQALNVTNWDPANTGHIPELGGFSTGGDVTPEVNIQGELDTNAATGASWYYLSFSVKDQVGFDSTNSATNAPGLIGLIQEQDDTAEGAVFGYAADGSVGIPSDYVDTIRVDYTRSQLNPAGTGDWDLTALDWGMGVISRTPNGTNSSLFAERELFYFTLTNDWLETANASISETTSSPSLTLNSRTIYVMQWDATTGWSFPEVAWDEVALFGAAEPNAEIDALSVYKGDNVYDNPERVVFSLVQEPLGTFSSTELNDPFLVAQHANAGNGTPDVPAVSLKTDGGVRFSTKTQIDPTTGPDTHGFCGLDPDDMTQKDDYVAWPTNRAEISPGLAKVGFAMWREEGVPGDGYTLHLEANGGKDEGVAVGIVEFQIAVAPLGGTLPAPTSYTVPFLVNADATHSSFPIDDSILISGQRYIVEGRAVVYGFSNEGDFLLPVTPYDSWSSQLIHTAQ